MHEFSADTVRTAQVALDAALAENGGSISTLEVVAVVRARADVDARVAHLALWDGLATDKYKFSDHRRAVEVVTEEQNSDL